MVERFFVAVAAAILLSLPAQAQEIREFDKVWLKGKAKPLIGTITSPADASKLVIKLKKGGVITEWGQDQIDRVQRRQGPLAAFKEKAAELQKADKTTPDADAHLALAEWCIDNDLAEQAQAEVNAVLSIDGKLRSAYELGVQVATGLLKKSSDLQLRTSLHEQLASLAQRAEANGCWTASIGLAKAQALVAESLPEAALREFRRVSDAVSKVAEPTAGQRYARREALYGLSLAELAVGRTGTAIKALDSLLGEDSSNFKALLARGRAHYIAGNLNKSLADLDAALGIEEKVAEALALRGAVRGDLRRFKEAEADLRQALALGSGQPDELRTQLGLLQLRQGRLKAAATEFLATRHEGRGYGPAELGLALIFHRRKEDDRALEQLRKAETLMPADPVTKALKARMQVLAGKPKAAAASFADALRLGFEPRLGIRALSRLASSQGESGRALALLKYLTVENAGADDLYALGRAWLKRGRPGRAKRAFVAAIKLDSEHVLALCGLGFLEYSGGDFAAGKGRFETVLRLEPGNAYAKRALRNIQESRTRRVWSDSFEREDGSEVQNRWLSSGAFGMRVRIDKGMAVFSGAQSNLELGKTELSRTVDDGAFVKLEVSLVTAGSGAARVGIRVRGRSGAELILFRSGDGKKLMGGSRRSKSSPIETLDFGRWPGDVKAHTLSIEIEDEGKGVVSFALDGERVGEIKAPSFRGKVKPSELVIYGQAKLGKSWRLAVDKVRLFVRREVGVKKKGGL